MKYSEIINSDPVVLVEFFASWCPHCRKMKPVVEHIKELLDGRVPVCQIDIDENEADAGMAGVDSVPTFIIYKDANPVWRHIGEIDGDMLLSKVESYVSVSAG